MDERGSNGLLQKRRVALFAALSCTGLIAVVAAVTNGCSGNSASPSSNAMTSASVMLSDPATCMAPSGPYSHVYVTVTDVKASVNASAGDNDPSFVDLTPGLSSAPKQIDLLGQANNQCFLATLGSTQQLQAGSYQQIRVILADNSATVANNACNGSANCVVLSSDPTHPVALQLSSESKTGIKIPSGQIANGGFTIAAGQTKDLDIDFNTCISIVKEGNGQYRVKPVLHAGEVTTTSSSINGIVLDSSTGNPVAGSVMVALEQKDTSGTDRVFMSTLTDTSGAFVFCPLPAGTYDVVIVGERSNGTAFAPSIITGVTPGSALSTIQLHPQLTGALGPATLQGLVTSQNTATPAAGISIDVQVSALEPVASNLTVTIPLLPNSTQSTATLAVATASGGSCQPATDCASYAIQLPAATPYVGAFTTGGTTLSVSAIAASYTVDGIATIPSSGGTLDCSTSDLKATAVTPVAGITTPVATLTFTGCQ
jgi:hypothetical protein